MVWAVPGWPNVAATIRVSGPPAWLPAAMTRHPPRAFVRPVLRPRACDDYAAASDGWTAISGPDPPEGSGWSCRTTYAVITLATLAIGTGRVAPGPATTPKPLMSAAETPSAGHETAASRSRRGAAVPAPGVSVPEGDVTKGRGVTGAEGNVFSSARAKP